MKAESKDQEIALSAWDPSRSVKAIDPLEARVSRGFLRCMPERWFPSFPTQWLPLVHSLGADVRLLGVKPMLSVPANLEHGFVGTIDDEPVAMMFDRASAQTWVESIIPGLSSETGVDGKAASVLLEYSCRRLLTSLALSWTGPDPSIVRFDPELRLDDVRSQGAIRLSISVNGREATIWLGLGGVMLSRLDGLWRRQLHSASRGAAESAVDIAIEIAQLAVPPSMLVEYTRPGTIVDLEVVVSDSVTIKQGPKPWLPARLCAVGGKFAFEVLGGPLSAPILPEGTTRLSIQFGRFRLDPGTAAELVQPGAIYETALGLSDKVELVINGEVVAQAALCTYEGRFAMNVY